jgi:ATP-dependent Lhr-like helicase
MVALRHVARWRVIAPDLRPGDGDPTRWLPASHTPSPVVQRRRNLRRLPKWRRPDLEETEPDRWPGRWSLVRTFGVLGPEREESELASIVAGQWIDRYGVVSRDVWRRERPPVPWRSIYRELRRLEMRGDVRRGHFVDALTGAQFAHPAAVELLRAEVEAEAPVIVMGVVDPANVHSLPVRPEMRDGFARAARGGVLASIAGEVVLVSDRRGRAMRVRDGMRADDVTRAVRATLDYLTQRMYKPRDIVLESIDGRPAATSEHAVAFVAAGFRRATRALRWYRPV